MNTITDEQRNDQQNTVTDNKRLSLYHKLKFVSRYQQTSSTNFLHLCKSQLILDKI